MSENNITRSFRLVAQNGKLLGGKNFMQHIERISKDSKVDIAVVVTVIPNGYSNESQVARLNHSITTAMQMARDMGVNTTYDEARMLLLDKAGFNRDMNYLSKAEMSELIEHSEMLINDNKLFD